MSTTALPQAVDRVTTGDVARLAGARAWPSISILLDTTSGIEMSDEDERRLAELVELAEGRLRDQGLRSTRLVATLRAQAEEASREPTGRALAIFVNQAVARRVRLPAPVRPRVVVERTFATRDLVQVLHRTPPHLVLVLHAGCAHLYRGYADTLHPVREHGFPFEQALDLAEGRRRDEDEARAFLDQVDSALGRARRAHPSPLVLAGSTSAVNAFTHSSRNLHRLAAALVGQDARDLAGIQIATRAAMDRYLLSREAEALATLNRALASNPGTVVTGAVRCWEALHGGRPKMLVVEEGFFFPGRVTANGVHPVGAAEGAGIAADHLQDVVDDLVETVIERGGWVAFTKDGALERHGRIALLLGAEPGSWA
jgi:hypothetical protein